MAPNGNWQIDPESPSVDGRGRCGVVFSEVLDNSCCLAVTGMKGGRVAGGDDVFKVAEFVWGRDAV